MDSTLIHIDKKIRNGEKSGLKELILLDGISISKKTALLKQYWFDNNLINNTKSSKALTKYYFEQEDNIEYSILLSCFYKDKVKNKNKNITVVPIEKHKISFEDWSRTFKQYMIHHESKEAQKWIHLLDDYFSLKIRNRLQNVVSQIISNKDYLKNKEIWETIVSKLIEIPSVELFGLLEQLYSKDLISTEVLNYSYGKILRIPYNSGVISLKEDQMSIVNFHINTYEKKYNVHRFFFESDADFLVYIATKMDGNSQEIQAVISDLLLTNDPSTLYYIPVIIWRNRELINQGYLLKLMNINNSLANEKALWKGKPMSLNFKNKNRDEVWQAYIRFWALHYNNYKYEKETGQFINKNSWQSDFEKNEKLYKRLNATSDSIVMNAYLQLAQSNPRQIEQLNEKYKDFLRQTSASIPSLKYKVLPALSKLTNLNNKHEINYTSSIFSGDINLLKQQNITINQRLKLENKIIKNIGLESIPHIEWESLVYAQNTPFNFSCARIINHSYNKYWKNIVYDEKQLEYFISKAQILSQTSLFGFCKNYMNIFQIDNTFAKHLVNIRNTNLDEDIEVYIKSILLKSDANINFTKFKEIIKSDDKNGLRKHKLIDSIESYESYATTIKDEKEIITLLEYIKYHKDIDWTPMIMHWLINESSEKIIQKSIERLEKQYKFKSPSDPKTFWTTKWKNDGDNYKSWDKELFDLKIASLLKEEEIDAKTLNSITKSPQFNLLSEDIFNQLSLKLIQLKNLKYVQKRDLFTEDIALNLLKKNTDLKVWSEIFKHTKIVNIKDFFNKTLQLLESKDPLIKGEYISKTLEHPAFLLHFIYGEQDQEYTQNILKNIDLYLEEGDYDDFNEQLILNQHFVLSNAHLDFKSFMATFWNEQENFEDNTLSELIYSKLDVKSYLKIFDLLLEQDPALIKKINFDFGFPLFKYDRNSLVAFKSALEKDDLEKTYKNCLKEWPIDIWVDDKLDFDKIFNILLLDHVDTFIGTGGKYRDEYIFGLTQYLSLHFKDNLGYKFKMSEGQTFFKYNANKRIKDWLSYLEKHHLIQTKNHFTLNKLLHIH